ncbi:MAG: 4-hydroxy-tetrahydrodipicolinate synthase [Gemmatimonadales bacterium]|nr:4-hydroxy-tetrahydrodipicolinate synthase [Gemmatimonadales bacterium]
MSDPFAGETRSFFAVRLEPTLGGCGTALVTPFNADGSVDEGALAALAEWQVEAGIDFLVPCGSTGEAQTLDDAERVRVVEVVVAAARGRVPVVAGATNNDTRRAVAETRRMCDAGADWILSAAPYYNRPTPPGLVAHFTAVADASSRPVMLYNIPGRAAVNLAAPTVLELARHPRLRAIKESSGDLRQVMHLLSARPSGFLVLAGDDWIAAAVGLLGGDGLVSVTANVVPSLMRSLVQAAIAGRAAEAQALQWRLLPLMEALFLESNPGPVKAAVAMLGRGGEVPRLPLVVPTEATRAAVRAELARLGALA